ncbi:MAG: CAP domain-containing protein [Caldilineaceae bacterium]
MSILYEVKRTRPAVTKWALPGSTRRLVALLAMVGITVLAVSIPHAALADSDAPELHRAALLPLIRSSPKFDAATMCALNVQEGLLLEYMRRDEQQQRGRLHCNPILSQVARAHAQDMAQRRYFDHVNPDGSGPNFLVTQAGYKLPDWYPEARDANNLESIGAHFATAEKVWTAWTNSPGHRLHVLGLDSFWAEHTEIGVGYYFDENSEYGAYWVLITAPPEP